MSQPRLSVAAAESGDWISLAALREAGDKDIPSGFDLLWQGMKRSNAYGGLVAGIGEQFSSMADRTRSSILGTAKASLEFMAGPPMQRLLEVSDFDLAALKTDPCGFTLYLTLPQRYMSTHYRWLRLMTSLAIGEMERIKGAPATGYPTLFILDEFAGLKRMEVIEHAAAQAAGFGAKFFFVVQNLTQIKEAYKDSWETFLGNSGLKIFFHIEDDFTRSYVTRQMGEREVHRTSRSGSQSHSTSRSVTAGESLSSTLGVSDSVTKGRNFGRSFSRTTGSSQGDSVGYDGPLRIFSTSESKQRGDNRSKSRSNTIGWSNSTSSSQSRSRSSSTSSSRSSSNSESATEGWSEAVHKRSLLNPDEVGRLLARVDDRAHPGYPGILLALTPGENPLLARRVNYFESPQFSGFFDPHPGYPLPPTLARLAELQAEPKPETKPAGGILAALRKWRAVFSLFRASDGQSHLRRAQLSEARGDYKKARVNYLYVLVMHTSADPSHPLYGDAARGVARVDFLELANERSKSRLAWLLEGVVTWYGNAGNLCSPEEINRRIEAQYRLARLYENELDQRPDYARAIGLYARAAAAGHSEARQRLLSLIAYRSRIWVTDTPVPCYRPEYTLTIGKYALTRAVLLALAARALRKAEDASAELRLARLEVNLDYARACKSANHAKSWYSKALRFTRSSDPNVLYSYARFWELDPHTKDFPMVDAQHYQWSIVWCTTAAGMGHVEAAYRAAYLRDEGLGLKQDLIEAIKWYAVAAEAGYEDARDRLLRLVNKKLPADEGAFAPPA